MLDPDLLQSKSSTTPLKMSDLPWQSVSTTDNNFRRMLSHIYEDCRLCFDIQDLSYWSNKGQTYHAAAY